MKTQEPLGERLIKMAMNLFDFDFDDDGEPVVVWSGSAPSQFEAFIEEEIRRRNNEK